MTELLYHLVFPAKYRRAVIDSKVMVTLLVAFGKHGDEAMIAKICANQGGEYEALHKDHQLSLF